MSFPSGDAARLARAVVDAVIAGHYRWTERGAERLDDDEWTPVPQSRVLDVIWRALDSLHEHETARGATAEELRVIRLSMSGGGLRAVLDLAQTIHAVRPAVAA